MENFFVKRSEEIKLTIQGKDKDLLEGYSNFTKPELKKLDLFYDNLLKSCTMLQEAAKVVRTPRKKKPVSMEKLVSKVKYKKEDNDEGGQYTYRRLPFFKRCCQKGGKGYCFQSFCFLPEGPGDKKPVKNNS